MVQEPSSSPLSVGGDSIGQAPEEVTRGFIQLLETSPPVSVRQFQMMMLMLTLLTEATPRQMADDLGLTMMSCERYFKGDQTPNPAIYPLITEWVLTQLRGVV